MLGERGNSLSCLLSANRLAALDMDYPTDPTVMMGIRVSESPETDTASMQSEITGYGYWAYLEVKAKTELVNSVAVHRVRVSGGNAGDLLLQDTFTSTPTLRDAGIPVGSAWIVRGERHKSNPALLARQSLRVTVQARPPLDYIRQRTDDAPSRFDSGVPQVQGSRNVQVGLRLEWEN